MKNKLLIVFIFIIFIICSFSVCYAEDEDELELESFEVTSPTAGVYGIGTEVVKSKNITIPKYTGSINYKYLKSK